jgi:hypothetical protein
MDNSNFSSKTVDAEYSEQVLSEYQDNPFIEALPPILSREEMYEQLKRDPEYDKEDLHIGGTIFEIERDISAMIRAGYLHRNHSVSVDGLDAFRHNYVFSPISKYYDSSKIKEISKVLSYYPQTIRHKSYRGKRLDYTQITWLKFSCSPDGGVKEVCNQFFADLDHLAGNDFYGKYAELNLSIMLSRMSVLAEKYKVGLIVVDELQNLITKDDKESKKAINFLFSLGEDLQVPMILIGTNEVFKLRSKNFKLSRRLA